jgi:hypothetical protein
LLAQVIKLTLALGKGANWSRCILSLAENAYGTSLYTFPKGWPQCEAHKHFIALSQLDKDSLDVRVHFGHKTLNFATRRISYLDCLAKVAPAQDFPSSGTGIEKGIEVARNDVAQLRTETHFGQSQFIET